MRASPGTVPSPGTSLAGTADWSLGGAPPGPAASVYRSRCGGDAGTGTRPPRGPGGAPLAPPWCPVGERRGGRRAPRCPTGPRLEELVPGAVGEPLGEETPLSLGIAKRSGYPFAGVGGRGSLRLSSRHGCRGSPCSSSNRFRDVLHQVRGRGGVPGCSPGATYRMLPGEPGSEGVDDGDCSGLNSSPPPEPWACSAPSPSRPLGCPWRPGWYSCVVSGSAASGTGGAPAARWHRWSRRPRGLGGASRGPPGPGGEPRCREGWGGAREGLRERVRGSSASECACNTNTSEDC